MGAWGVLAFDNDTANDWAYDLEDVDDLSLAEGAFDQVEQAGGEYLDADAACEALAACEVVARLEGRPGYTNTYTEKVDQWVEAHPMVPPVEVVTRANAVIDRILGENSELRELWQDAGEEEWLQAVADLRRRING
jgi:hypothetical protein